jgi:hypothetical protein
MIRILTLELAARQHDRFCISQSRIANSPLLDDFENRTRNDRTRKDRKRQCIECEDQESMSTTALPLGWTLHKSVFSLSKSGDEWSTHHGKHTFANSIVYPNFVSGTPGQIFDQGEDLWVMSAVEKADELGYRSISVSCCASIPTERVERSGMQTMDLFRCHPSFHSYPYLRRSWHDWAMIEWAHEGAESAYTVAARLLMFAKLSDHEDGATTPRVMAVVQSLSEHYPQPDSLLKFCAR